MYIQDIKTHYPGRSYSNSELRKILYPQDVELSEVLVKLGGKHFVEEILASEHFFEQLGVESRNILCDPADSLSWWHKYAGTDPFALEAAIAYEKLMKNQEPLEEDDRLIVVGNAVDTVSPNIGYAVLAHLQTRNEGFVHPSVIALVGEGCSGFISGLREADIYIQAKPKARVVIITVEMMATPLLNPWIQPQLIAYINKAPREEMASLCGRLMGLGIQRYLFGEGCAAALCSIEAQGMRLSRFHRWANLNPKDMHLLDLIGTNTKKPPHTPPFGFFYQQPDKMMQRLMESYLPAAYEVLSVLPLKDFHCAIHTGSGKILNYVQQALHFTDEQVVESRHILRDQGNMNATTGAAILAEFMKKQITEQVLAVFFGVGFALQVAY